MLKLDLYGNHIAIGNESTQHIICEPLKDNNTLLSLDLSENQIGEFGTKLVSQELIVNHTHNAIRIFLRTISIKEERILCLSFHKVQSICNSTKSHL
ncbi:leucine-rich repeat-containing protein 74a [Anaeramoeba flamelloides]|uniref:Leucine-rich repeat-containing protein 74a n=1 Tax=Anaeramoeba flamelloides TaxID=1746091 RepID=A0AAV7Y5A8_9EUKA|nr:leucine-rich repeat-containing protein 74a [Anaeramoeba flamelloides]